MKRNLITILLTVIAVLALTLSGCTAAAPSAAVTNPDANTPQNNSQSSTNNSVSSPSANQSSSTGPGTNPVASVSDNGTGNLEIKVTDAPAEKTITAIWVTVSGVEIHKAGADDSQEQEQETEQENDQDTESEENTNENENTNESSNSEDNNSWMTVDITGSDLYDADAKGAVFNLLEVAKNPETLSFITLDAGIYTQIRMQIAEVKVCFDDGNADTDDISIENGTLATIPSGKLKFVKSFEVVDGETTQLLFDFDAAQSVNVTGKGDVMFKPVIKITSNNPEDDEDTDEESEDNEVNSEDEDTDEAESLEITTEDLTSGVINVSYDNNDVQLTAANGVGDLTWAITFAASEDETDPYKKLPAGMALNEVTGEITGTPTVTGKFRFEVTVTDSSDPAQTDTKRFTLVIAAGEDVDTEDSDDTNTALEITNDVDENNTLALDAVVGEEFKIQLKANGGSESYTWAITSGALPDDFDLNEDNGKITGTAAAAGSYNFTVTVTDDSDATLTDSIDCTLTVAAE